MTPDKSCSVSMNYGAVHWDALRHFFADVKRAHPEVTHTESWGFLTKDFTVYGPSSVVWNIYGILSARASGRIEYNI